MRYFGGAPQELPLPADLGIILFLWWGAASRGGGRQLTARGGCTRWRGARVWTRWSERGWSGSPWQLSGGRYGGGQSDEVAKEEENGAPR
jgi:hypothetical protein